MRQYLCEGATGAFTFIVDRSKPVVSESKPSGASYTRIPGRLSVCDCVNGNNRRYSKRVWEKNLQSGSTLQESIKRNAAFGLLEHPKDGMISLNSPISHQVTKAELIESKDATGKTIWEVTGEITLYDTAEGHKLRALIEGGYNPLVSSRGFGSLQRASDGVDDVCEDYVCESWDVVIKPSFEQAELIPCREPAVSSTNARMAAPVAPQAESAPAPQASLAESKGVNLWSVYQKLAEQEFGKPFNNLLGAQADSIVAKASALNRDQLLALESKNLKESHPSTGEVSSSATSAPKQKLNSMELNEIKGRIAALESLEPSKLSPQRVAESLNQIEEMHQSVAEYAATDPKRSWDGEKLHRQLDGVSKRFSESAELPVRQAHKLQENNEKLMKIITATAQTALVCKKKLGEALKTQANGQKLKEELVSRGQGWKRVAESRQQKLSVLEQDFSDACSALDIMSKRYHEDTTELAKRLIVLEFKEKAATPEIQKALKEATRLRHIAAIRETLEGKKAPGVGKPAEGAAPACAKKDDCKDKDKGECVAKAPGKVTTESKETPTEKASAAAPVTEAKTSPVVESGAKIVLNTRDPRSLSESINLVKRLSTSAK